MKTIFSLPSRFVAATLGLAGLASLALLPAQAQDAKPLPPALTLPTQPPAGAVVLFSGKPEEIANNFVKRRTTMPANGTVENGVWTPNHSDITSKQEFGDCYMHVEFRCPEVGDGNAGIGLQGRYEVQIYNTFGKTLDKLNGGALYSQIPATANASKKPGEWQTYDIIFRAPRFDAEGKVTEKPRVTLFWNGVIAQNNTEFLGPTGIQYEQYKGMTPTGPIILQGDHSVVQYRNVWLVPM